MSAIKTEPVLSGPALIDATELARLLSVSKMTIWRLRDDGKLPPAISLTSQCVRWRRAAVLTWIDAGCPPPVAASSEA